MEPCPTIHQRYRAADMQAPLLPSHVASCFSKVIGGQKCGGCLRRGKWAGCPLEGALIAVLLVMRCSGRWSFDSEVVED